MIVIKAQGAGVSVIIVICARARPTVNRCFYYCPRRILLDIITFYFSTSKYKSQSVKLFFEVKSFDSKDYV